MRQQACACTLCHNNSLCEMAPTLQEAALDTPSFITPCWLLVQYCGVSVTPVCCLLPAGVEASREAAFVLVAGGLGERLKYSGNKIALPTDLARGACFLQVLPLTGTALQRTHSGRQGPCSETANICDRAGLTLLSSPSNGVPKPSSGDSHIM